MDTFSQRLEDALERYRVAVDALAYEESEGPECEPRVDFQDAAALSLAELRQAIVGHARESAARAVRPYADREARLVCVLRDMGVSNG